MKVRFRTEQERDMSKTSKAVPLIDSELDAAQGGGLMDTPLGGWGVADDETQAIQPLSNVLKNRTQSAPSGVRNVN